MEKYFQNININRIENKLSISHLIKKTIYYYLNKLNIFKFFNYNYLKNNK